METTLVESVDDAIVELCSRRKRYPQKLTINCRKLLEAQTVNCVSMQKGGGVTKCHQCIGVQFVSFPPY